MKRFYNYLKRKEEQAAWERQANPEDIEFVKCQEELNDQLLEQFTQVERVIGGCLSVCVPVCLPVCLYVCLSICLSALPDCVAFF